MLTTYADAGATDLARALDVNKGMKVLILSGNGIAGPGAQVRLGAQGLIH
jgi:hypothetical protein